MSVDETRPLVELRPLNLGDVLDSAVRLCRRHVGTFLGISAVIHVPVTILGGASTWLVNVASRNAGPKVSEAFLGALTVHMLVIGVMMIVLPICQAALSLAVSDAYLGRPITVTEAYRRTLQRLWPLLGSIFLAGLVEALPLLIFALLAGVSLGAALALRQNALIVLAATVTTVAGLAALAGFMLFYIWFLFAPVVVVVEGRGALDSLRRSRDLVQGRGWAVFGAWIVLLLLVYAINGAFSAVLTIPGAVLYWQELKDVMTGGGQPEAFIIWAQIASNLGGVIVMPLLYTGVVLLYYDQRVRREGFDLEMMAQSFGLAPVEAATAPPAAPEAEQAEATREGPPPAEASGMAAVGPPLAVPSDAPRVDTCPQCGHEVPRDLRVCPECLQVIRPLAENE